MSAPEATLILPGGEFPTTIHILSLEENRYSVSSPLPQEVVRPVADNLLQLMRIHGQDLDALAAQEDSPEAEGPEDPAHHSLPDAGLTPESALTPEADTTSIRALEVAVPVVVDLDHWDHWCRESQGLDDAVDPRTHGHLVALYQKETQGEH